MLRLDPALQPLWRTPDAVQLGVDPVVAVVDPVPPGGDRVLAALVAGVGRARLRRVADEAGLARDDLTALLEALAPALLHGRRAAATPLRVAIDGPDDLVALLRGLVLLGERPAEPADSDLVLVLAHHLVPPAATVRHLAEDRRHLPVVFGDQAVTIGPVVEPGATPCLRCAEEHRLDDPDRRVVAMQLLRRRTSRTGSSAGAALRAALVLGDALAAMAESRACGLEDAALRMAPDGAVTRSPTRWHGRCGCRNPAA